MAGSGTTDAVHWVAAVYVAGSVAGAVVSVHEGRGARFAGVSLPGPPLLQALTIGTPLSAPPALLAALLLAELRSEHQWRRRLAAVFAVGVLGEPDTWRALIHARDRPVTTALVALDLVMPLAMLGC